MTNKLNRRQLAAALAEIDAQLAEVDEMLVIFGEIHEATGYADPEWNDYHDKRSALEAERRRVELNRAPIMIGSTEDLASQNID